MERSSSVDSSQTLRHEFTLLASTLGKTLTNTSVKSDHIREKKELVHASRILQEEAILASGLEAIRPCLRSYAHKPFALPIFSSGALISMHLWAQIVSDLMGDESRGFTMILGAKEQHLSVLDALNAKCLSEAFYTIGQRPIFAHETKNYQSSPSRRGALNRIAKKLKKGMEINYDDIIPTPVSKT